jgi:hypothetical protein
MPSIESGNPDNAPSESFRQTVPRLSEFEFGRAGFDDLGVCGLGLALGYTKSPL